ncbi:MAG: heterodisulfide reductase subunit C [candidate division WS1 bacterium]|nr:heterodisulfide reductase subunit C [candidate division WS1 bacterium]
MRLLEKDKTIESEPDFVEHISEISGEDVRQCYQCGKCLAGCPMVEEMDLTPSQVMRAVQAGLKDLVLDSHTIWCCAGCETCAARCPKGIDLCHVMKALTSEAFAEGRTQSAPDIAAFHRSFLDTVSVLGRNYELGMMGLLKLRTRNLLQDVALGMKLFARGKLNLIPEYIKGNAEVRRMIRQVLDQPRPDRTGVSPVTTTHEDAGETPAPPGHGAGEAR